MSNKNKKWIENKRIVMKRLISLKKQIKDKLNLLKTTTTYRYRNNLMIQKNRRIKTLQKQNL